MFVGRNILHSVSYIQYSLYFPVSYVRKLNIPSGVVGACHLTLAYEHFKVRPEHYDWKLYWFDRILFHCDLMSSPILFILHIVCPLRASAIPHDTR